MPDKKKRICPVKRCKKENESGEDGAFANCAGCGLDFGAFDARRLVLEAERDQAEEEAEEKKKHTPPAKKKGMLSNL